MQPWIRTCTWVAGALALSVLMGCASVTQGMDQSVRVETQTAQGELVNDAECVLTSPNGRAVVRSGQSVPVRRAGGDMLIRCEKAGHAPASGQAVSRANAGLAGNILLGGAIGAAIDVSNGAAYTYPTWMRLVFGEERLFDRQANRSDAMSAGVLLRRLDAAPVAAAGTAVAAPPPATEAMAAVAPASPASLLTPLRRGDVLEYKLTDLDTGVSQLVRYQVDRVNAREIAFNQGTRVESSSGELVSLTSAAGGLFDSVSPPRGWVPSNADPGTRWSEDYLSLAASQRKNELRATVIDKNFADIDGQRVDVVRTRYEGWIYVPPGSYHTPGAVPASQFKADVAYAPALRRVVQFEAERRLLGTRSRERLELVRILR